MPTVRSLCTLPYRTIRGVIGKLPVFRFDMETRQTQTPATIEAWFLQNVLGINRGPYWPVHHSSKVVDWRKIHIGVETSPGISGGCYIQGIGGIEIGDYTQIAPNVAIISANHSLYDNRVHEAKRVTIGKYCWLGFGSVILPGVTLGDFTVVGANTTVTKSFPEGHCVLVGSPAKQVSFVDIEKCVRHMSKHEYHGFIPARKFAEFRNKHLVDLNTLDHDH
jgi:acetyltransferase-like isoleucine patch superfamily enzyme